MFGSAKAMSAAKALNRCHRADASNFRNTNRARRYPNAPAANNSPADRSAKFGSKSARWRSRLMKERDERDSRLETGAAQLSHRCLFHNIACGLLVRVRLGSGRLHG